MLWNVDWTLHEPNLVGIVGPNGAGKSTLLKALLGLAPHIEGRIESTAKRIAYLPQQAEIDRSFPISVFDTVLLGRWSRFGGFGAAKHVDIHDAQHAGARQILLHQPVDAIEGELAWLAPARDGGIGIVGSVRAGCAQRRGQ